MSETTHNITGNQAISNTKNNIKLDETKVEDELFKSLRQKRWLSLAMDINIAIYQIASTHILHYSILEGKNPHV